MDDRSEGGDIDDGVFILPILVECHYGNSCKVNCIDEVSAPSIVKVLPDDSARRGEDGNFISKSHMTVNFRPTGYDDKIDLTLSEPWRMPWSLDIDLTSSTLQLEASYTDTPTRETSTGIQENRSVVAAAIYSLLLTASHAPETTITVLVHGAPPGTTFAGGFNGDYHWDDQKNRLTTGTLNGYHLIQSKTGGFFCTTQTTDER